jgi:hypothetical protein
MPPQTAYNVRLNGKLIDTVFYSNTTDADEVKHSLINHDGYDPGITVTKARKRKTKAKPVLADLGPVGPVPNYDPKTDGDYSAWLVFNNID